MGNSEAYLIGRAHVLNREMDYFALEQIVANTVDSLRCWKHKDSAIIIAIIIISCGSSWGLYTGTQVLDLNNSKWTFSIFNIQ